MEDMRLENPKERKKLFGKPRCRWQDNIGMDHREIGWKDVYWINLA
jgi:hypothetical protein